MSSAPQWREVTGAEFGVEFAKLGLDEAETNLIAGLHRSLQTEPNCLFAIAEENNIPVAAAFDTGVSLLLTDGDDSTWQNLVKFLGSRPLRAVCGPPNTAKFFAQTWSLEHGCKSRLSMEQAIFKLENVIPPARPALGYARSAEEKERAMIERWLFQFYFEACPQDGFTQEDAIKTAQNLIAKNSIWIWEDGGGRPVCMAAFTRESANGITLNCVYSPIEVRGQGYATSLVAKMSEHALNSGKKFCTLYTDLSNPTSNSIYQKIGYRKIADSSMYSFS